MQFKRATAFRRSVPVAVLVGLMAFTAPIPPVAAYADNAAQQLESELSVARAKLDELSHRLELAAATVEDTEFQLEETTSEIESLKSQIKEGKEKVSAAQADIAVTVTESYKGGDFSLLDLILSSNNFDELTSRLFYANKIAVQNSAKIKEVNGLISTLSEQKESLSQKEKQLSSLLEERKVSKRDLEASRAEVQSYVDGLSDELQAVLKSQREAEAERQKAELEAQQLAQQQRPQGNTGNVGNSESNSGNADNADGVGSSGNNGGAAGGGNSDASSGNLSSVTRSAIVTAAQSQVGVAYELGACVPGVAMDCSGLTYYAYRQAGVSITRTSRSQYNQVVRAGNLKSSAGSLEPGDLVFYQRGGVIYHVAIYIGAGNVCHANGYGQGVVITGVFYDAGFCGGGSPV